MVELSGHNRCSTKNADPATVICPYQQSSPFAAGTLATSPGILYEQHVVLAPIPGSLTDNGVRSTGSRVERIEAHPCRYGQELRTKSWTVWNKDIIIDPVEDEALSYLAWAVPCAVEESSVIIAS